MSFQPGYTVRLPPMLGTFSYPYANGTETTYSSIPTSAAAQGFPIYYPLMLPSPYVVKRVWWQNGSTTNSATIEVGLYADVVGSYQPGALLFKGSGTQVNINAFQFASLSTPVYVPAGLWWLAICPSTTTSTTIMRSSNTNALDAALLYKGATASSLPATADPVEGTGQPAFVFGIAST